MPLRRALCILDDENRGAIVTEQVRILDDIVACFKTRIDTHRCERRFGCSQGGTHSAESLLHEGCKSERLLQASPVEETHPGVAAGPYKGIKEHPILFCPVSKRV